jgi:hypothetical protein
MKKPKNFIVPIVPEKIHALNTLAAGIPDEFLEENLLADSLNLSG